MGRESISEVVRQCLDETSANLRSKRAGADEWTREIKMQMCLAVAAQQPPLHVCASGIEHERRQPAGRSDGGGVAGGNDG